MQTVNARQALQRLSRFEADLAVIGGSAEPQEGFGRRKLFDDPMWFVVPPGHPLVGQKSPLADVLAEPFLMREEGSRTREMLLSFCRAENLAPPPVGAELGAMNEAVRAVAAGYGVLFASAAEVQDYVRRGEVARVHVAAAEIRNPVAVYWREGESLSPSAAAFLTLIGEDTNLQPLS